MIEVTIRNYLLTELGCPVYMEEPKTQPEEYVILEKLGGGEDNHIKSAMLAIQSHAGSLYEAATLNDAVKEAMKGITSLGAVSKCDLNSDYNYTDTTKKKYRYQAVFDLVFFD